jgi:hypothetical protein
MASSYAHRTSLPFVMCVPDTDIVGDSTDVQWIFSRGADALNTVTCFHELIATAAGTRSIATASRETQMAMHPGHGMCGHDEDFDPQTGLAWDSNRRGQRGVLVQLKPAAFAARAILQSSSSTRWTSSPRAWGVVFAFASSFTRDSLFIRWVVLPHDRGEPPGGPT